MSRTTSPGIGRPAAGPVSPTVAAARAKLASIPSVRMEAAEPISSAPPPPPAGTDKTRTLRGMGPSRPPREACPCCHVKSDGDVDATIAMTFGAALIIARGVQGFSLSLCPRHRSMMRALEHELASPSGGDW